MKLGLKYAAHAWSYYGIALAVSLVFLGGMGSAWYALALNALLILGMMVMALNDGAYNGEKACTLAVSLDKQVKEGRRVDEKLKAQVYDRKIAAWIMIFGVAPFLLLSTINAIVAPFYPEVVVETEAEASVEEEGFKFNYGDEEVEEAEPINVVNVIARIAFMPFVSVYTLVSGKVLNALFFLFSLPIPLMETIGYLNGPKMREKKLKDIALGKKRKMRNLKVNKKPRQQKAEV